MFFNTVNICTINHIYSFCVTYTIFLCIISHFPSFHSSSDHLEPVSWKIFFSCHDQRYAGHPLAGRFMVSAVWLAIKYLLCNQLFYSFFEFSTCFTTSYFIYLFKMSRINLFAFIICFQLSQTFLHLGNFLMANHDQKIEN